MGNIVIDVNSFQRLFSTIITRLSAVNGTDLFFILLSVFMPPLAVMLKVGFTVHFWMNILLTVIGVVPGQIHALWVVLFLK